MKKIIQKLKEVEMLWVAVAITVFLIVAAIDFFFTKTGGVNGWQIVFNQTANEWFWMIFFSALAGGVVWGYTKFYNKKQDTKGYRPFAWAFIIFVSIAFGKGCTDKANGGVTSGNGRPGGPAPTEDNRVPAEDLLPKK